MLKIQGLAKLRFKIMVYLYIFLLVIIPVAATFCFLYALRNDGLPANSKLLVDAWNMSSEQNKDSSITGRAGE